MTQVWAVSMISRVDLSMVRVRLDYWCMERWWVELKERSSGHDWDMLGLMLLFSAGDGVDWVVMVMQLPLECPGQRHALRHHSRCLAGGRGGMCVRDAVNLAEV